MTETLAAELQKVIEAGADDPNATEGAPYREAVEETIARLDRGELRLANKIGSEWKVNAWIQVAINKYFKIPKMETLHAGPFEYYDRLPLKNDYAKRGIRVVPGGFSRYGSHIEPGVVLLPCFINIGAYVATGSLVDTWATVGSGGQIGKNCHLAGGVGIGGVLEPPGARPVIIEDNVFVGSRCILVEGVLIEEGAVLASNVSITGTTHVIDVTQKEPVTYKGFVPKNSVVIPGTRKREFPAGEYEVSCALIIGKRSEQTDRKVALMDAAREFGVSFA